MYFFQLTIVFHKYFNPEYFKGESYSIRSFSKNVLLSSGIYKSPFRNPVSSNDHLGLKQKYQTIYELLFTISRHKIFALYIHETHSPAQNICGCFTFDVDVCNLNSEEIYMENCNKFQLGTCMGFF